MQKLVSATPDDITTLAALHAACFDRGWGPLEFASFFERDTIIAALMYENDSPIGFTFAWPVAGECEFLAIGVIEAQRGKGIGKLLLEYTLKEAIELGAHIIHLEVRADNNAAITMYKKNGFEKLGLRKSYYTRSDGTKADAVTMRKKLNSGL